MSNNDDKKDYSDQIADYLDQIVNLLRNPLVKKLGGKSILLGLLGLFVANLIPSPPPNPIVGIHVTETMLEDICETGKIKKLAREKGENQGISKSVQDVKFLGVKVEDDPKIWKAFHLKCNFEIENREQLDKIIYISDINTTKKNKLIVQVGLDIQKYCDEKFPGTEAYPKNFEDPYSWYCTPVD